MPSEVTTTGNYDGKFVFKRKRKKRKRKIGVGGKEISRNIFQKQNFIPQTRMIITAAAVGISRDFSNSVHKMTNGVQEIRDFAILRNAGRRRRRS